MALKLCIVLSLVVLLLTLIFICVQMAGFTNESFDSQWRGNGNYSEQQGIVPPKHYINGSNGGFLMNPGNYRQLPWTRKTIYRYPFFGERYVTRPILSQVI